MKKLIIVLIWLGCAGSFALAQTTSEPRSPAKGAFKGAIEAKHPAWFKESFLEFSDDIDEATEKGKRLALYFWQTGCPYCNRLWEHNMSVDGIEQAFQSRFDVVALNMWGDKEVVNVAGKQFTEKQLARALDVDFTPTLLFFNEQKKVVLRLNGYLPPSRFKHALNYAAGESGEGQSFNEFMSGQPVVDAGLTRKQDFFKRAEQSLENRNAIAAERPLAVLFETADCASCEEFHDITLSHELTRDLFARMDVVQLDAHSNETIVLPDGKLSSPAKWAESLALNYYPSIAFFDENGELIILLNAYFRNFHIQSVFAYVVEKAYIEEPSFQRYITARAERLNEQGIDVDIWEK